MNAIEIDNLSKYYGDVKGIESLTIAVQPGEIVGFVGKNERANLQPYELC